MEKDISSRPITWEQLDLEHWEEGMDQEHVEYLQRISEKCGINLQEVIKIDCALWWSDPAEGGEMPEALDKVREVAQELGNDSAVIKIIKETTGFSFEENVSLDNVLKQLPNLFVEKHKRAVDIARGFLGEYFELINNSLK